MLRMTFTCRSSVIPGNILATILDFRSHLYREGAASSILVLPPLLVHIAPLPDRLVVPAGPPRSIRDCRYLTLEGREPVFAPLGPFGLFPFESLFLGWGSVPELDFDGCAWRCGRVADFDFECPRDPWWSAVRVEERFLA